MRAIELARVDNTPTSDNVEASYRAFQKMCSDPNFQAAAGVLSVWGYRIIPYFEALATDLDTLDSDSTLVVTHVLFHRHSDKSPTFVLERTNALFSDYRSAIDSLRCRADNVLIGRSHSGSPEGV